VSDDQERRILAAGRYIGEGFDGRRLDSLFPTMPISWKGTLAQYVGRLHWQHEGKTEVLVADYVDALRICSKTARPIVGKALSANSSRGSGYHVED
jgi:superfamily II DNA or RNA helicase